MKLRQGNIFRSMYQEFCPEGGIHGRGCMTGGMCGGGCAWQGGVHGKGACIGVHGREGCAWQGACVAGGGRGVSFNQIKELAWENITYFK